MKVFKSLKEVEKYIQKIANQNLEVIGEHVKSILKKIILDDLYRAYDPSEYERTNQFLEAVTVSGVKTKGNISEIEIYVDPDKLFPVQREKSEWSSYMSSLGKNYGDTSYGSMSISEWVVHWMEFGNRSPYSREPIEMYKKTRERLEDDHYIYNTMKSRFEDAGFKVVGGYL